MKLILQKFWDFEFDSNLSFFKKAHWIKWFIWIAALSFAFFTVMVTSGIPGSPGVTIFNIQEIIASYKSKKDGLEAFKSLLPYIWLIIAVIAVMSRTIIIISSYYLSVKKLGLNKFNFYFTTFITTFFIGVATLLLVSVGAWISVAMGYEADWVSLLVNISVENVNRFIESLIPFSLGLKSYGLSFLLTIFLIYLPGYLVHSLCHRSRLLWLIAHRPHHCPDFLFPLAAPNNNIAILEFLMAIPGIIFYLVISGMIYKEPLTLELAIWFTTALTIEAFNHSQAHYDFAFRNFLVRNMSLLFGGNGVYHLVHHSAYKEDQNVNFGGAPFLFWDRIFGTYRKPYEQIPPIGLTDQPEINMSPMKIVFGGFSQVWYELKMNKNFKTRLKIIFGGVFYKPPITKDFLVL